MVFTDDAVSKDYNQTKEKKRTEKQYNVYTHIREHRHTGKIFINTVCTTCIFSIRVQLEVVSQR